MGRYTANLDVRCPVVGHRRLGLASRLDLVLRGFRDDRPVRVGVVGELLDPVRSFPLISRGSVLMMIIF